AGDACGIDDLAAAALGNELFRGLLNADQHAHGVHIHDAMPIFLGDVAEWFDLCDTCIVEHRVQPPVFGDGTGNQLAHPGTVGHINGNAYCLTAVGADLGCCGLGAVYGDIGDHHMSAGLCQPCGYGAPDAAASAGDDD